MEATDVAAIARKHAVMVRIEGPDPKGLKMRRHPFHRHQDGRTGLSSSGVLLPESVSGAMPLVRRISGGRGVIVTTAFVVEPFRTENSNAAEVYYPELIAGTSIDVLIDRGDKEGCSFNERDVNSCWQNAELLAVIEVPTSSAALRSLVRSHLGLSSDSSWDVGWSLAPLSNDSGSIENLQKEILFDLSGSSPRPSISARIALLGITATNTKGLPHINISQSPTRGDLLLVMGSPFGILSPSHFFNSMSVGTVANCCPAGNSHNPLLIADIRCLPGTEGAPVFDKYAHLAGILSRPIRQKGSSIEIQFVITWDAIADACNMLPNEPNNAAGNSDESNSTRGSRNLLSPCGNSVKKSVERLPTNSHLTCMLQSPIEKAIASIVLITVGDGAWASGVLLNERGLILTNAHLLEPWRYGRSSLFNVTNEMMRSPRSSKSFFDELIQKNKTQQMPSNLPSSILRNSGRDSSISSSYKSYQTLRIRLNHMKTWIWRDARVVFISKGPTDVALLQVEHVPDKLSPVSVNYTSPSPGSQVHVIGHGPFGPRSDVHPHVSSGIVAKIVRGPRSQLLAENNMPEAGKYVPVMLETTAAVYAGMSGGAVVDSNGDMIGLVTSNAKHGGTAIIPEMNFSIPCTALEPVFKFAVEGDLSILLVLNKQNELLSSVWSLKPLPSSESESLLQKLKKEGKGSRFSEFLAQRNIEALSQADHNRMGKPLNKVLSKL